MASAKFLEEALSTDVDESAVNAIVGSLETQLVTATPTVVTHQASPATVSQQNHQVNSAIANGGTITAVQPQKHGISNGGGATTVNSLMTQEVSKSITTSTLLPVNVVTSNTVVPQVTTQQQHTQSAGIPPGAYINQVTTNQVSSNQNAHIPSLTKTHEPVKIMYPAVGQIIATTGVVNANNKLSFPGAQAIGQLANGTLGITSQPVLQTTSNVVSNVGSVSQAGSQTVTGVNKQTALVIKTSVSAGGMVPVPMSVPVSVTTNAVSTALQAKAGVTSTIVPSNVQILNVNTMRPAAPVAGQQAGKQVTSRVVIGPHMVGTRPGAPGVRYTFSIHKRNNEQKSLLFLLL